jgi:hypothetical protein
MSLAAAGEYGFSVDGDVRVDMKRSKRARTRSPDARTAA